MDIPVDIEKWTLNRDVIFVHVPKCGGKSVWNAIPPKYKNKHGKVPTHLPLFCTDYPEGAFTFGFVRNPWDRQVSWYHYKTKSKPRPPSFESFLDDKGRAWVENYDLYSIDEALCVDFVGRYEDLERDFAKAMQAVGLKGKVELPLANISADRGERDYHSYYTSRTRDLMADWYAREIAAFAYEF